MRLLALVVIEPALNEISDTSSKCQASEKLGFYFINIIKDGHTADVYAELFYVS